VDGDSDETTEPITPEPAAEPEAGITSEQLRDYLARATFAQTRNRKGYQQAEVDLFLDRLSEAVEEGEPLAELVRRQRFDHVRLEDGYDIKQVDDFLAAVVDLDPHAVGERPELRRSSRLTRLFG
jgi:DivIVA domain-containing protein